MIRYKIGNAFKYFKNNIDYLKFKMSNNLCNNCCNLWEYTLPLYFHKSTTSPAYLNGSSDLADLEPFNSPNRIFSLTSIHYIDWFEVNGINIFGNQNWFTDTFRAIFNYNSIGNRGELDISAISIVDKVKSWIKNFNSYVNNKLTLNGIKGYQYSNFEISVSENSDTYLFQIKFYMILPKNSIVDNISWSRWTTTENKTETNWNYSPINNIHEFATKLVKPTNCNLL